MIDVTPGFDRLIGGIEENILQSNGGPIDLLARSAASDRFEFFNGPGRGVVFVTDDRLGDRNRIDTGGRAVVEDIVQGPSTVLVLEGPDRDATVFQNFAGSVEAMLFACITALR